MGGASRRHPIFGNRSLQAARWCDLSLYQSEQIYICPSDATADAKKLSYSMNQQMDGIAIASITEVSVKGLLVDEGLTLNDGRLGNNASDLVSLIHFDGGNLLYADGHVKWQKGDKVNPVSSHPEIFNPTL